MGAVVFYTLGIGKTPQEAFAQLREEARYEYGHGGYTGTIANKDSFIMLANKPFEDAHAVETEGERYIDNNDDRIYSKFAPAGCLPVELIKSDRGYLRVKDFHKNNKIPKDKVVSWLFFGWANS